MGSWIYFFVIYLNEILKIFWQQKLITAKRLFVWIRTEANLDLFKFFSILISISEFLLL